jgi:hypothetical protein
MRCRILVMSTLCSGILAASLFHASPARAQDSDPGYRIGETGPPAASVGQNPNGQPATDEKKDLSTQGPVRMARFSYVSGNVTWRAGNSGEWTAATTNQPIQQGAQVWINDGGRADIQFDDGSELRLGNAALVTLKLLYSDAQGEFSQITLNDGLATLVARHDVSVYQVDTPLVSVKSKGPSQIRFGVDSGAEIAVQRGSATVEGAQGKLTLNTGDYLDLANENSTYTTHPLPRQDSWDRWNADRNQLLDAATETKRHVPPNIGLVAGDLDEYGSWREDPKYGWVWVPRVSSSDWRPYHDGRWVWVDPYGWTWVGDEAWGWAPYHYGTWIDEPYGWAWCPGPASQYWCPGVVGFSVYGGDIGWAPLCPWEVRYPAAFSLGFWGNRWGFSFSIGWAGCYYPTGFGYCVGRPWGNGYLNHWGWEHGGFGGDRFDHDRFSHGQLAANHGFVPFNASHVAGATVATAEGFGGRGAYRALPRGGTSVFTHGQAVGLPTAGRAPFSGPANVTPTRLSTTATRSFAATAHPSQAVLQRSVYHASLPASVRRNVPSAALRGANAAAQARAGLTNQGTAGRTEMSNANRAAVNAGVTRSNDSRTYAAEAARQARASLGISHQQDGASSLRNGNLSGGRAYSSGSSGYSSGSRYGQSYGGAYRGSSAGGYHGSYNGNYHVDGGYRGGGGSFGGSRGGGGGGGSRGGGGRSR